MTLVWDHDTEVRSSILKAERRRSRRICDRRAVKIFDLNSNRCLLGETQDISTSGLCIELCAPAALTLGAPIALHVGHGDTPSLQRPSREIVPARIVWIKRNHQPGRGPVTIGVEFSATTARYLEAA